MHQFLTYLTNYQNINKSHLFIFSNQIVGIVKHILNITSLEFGIKT